MVQATRFLLRWVYLNNLIRDRAEIQSIPYIQHTHFPSSQQHQHQPLSWHSLEDDDVTSPAIPMSPSTKSAASANANMNMNTNVRVRIETNVDGTKTTTISKHTTVYDNYNQNNDHHHQPGSYSAVHNEDDHNHSHTATHHDNNNYYTQHTTPTRHHHYSQQNITPPPPPQPYSQQQQQQQHHHYDIAESDATNIHHRNPLPPHTHTHNNNNNHEQNEEQWKRNVLRAIAHYPPGTSRLLALDSLRLEMVHRLATELHAADVRLHQEYERLRNHQNRSSSSRSSSRTHSNKGMNQNGTHNIYNDNNHQRSNYRRMNQYEFDNSDQDDSFQSLSKSTTLQQDDSTTNTHSDNVDDNDNILDLDQESDMMMTKDSILNDNGNKTIDNHNNMMHHQNDDKSSIQSENKNSTKQESLSQDDETIINDYDDDDDPFRDADLLIFDEFQKATQRNVDDSLVSKTVLDDYNSNIDHNHHHHDSKGMKNDGDNDIHHGEQALLIITPNSTRRTQAMNNRYNSNNPNMNNNLDSQEQKQQQQQQNGLNTNIDSHQAIQDALSLQRETREYLPQLVSAVLHSPPPLTQFTSSTPHLDPIATLRKLLITRCIRDPDFGIELCWLLEAEVGRTWKTLFEHRQKTGRRLIIVLPAEKAAVIAKIGTEKRSAFDLLQDVESATAYGVFGDDYYDLQSSSSSGEVGNSDFTTMEEKRNNDGLDFHHRSGHSSSELYGTPRLPASLSLRRCSHFGDTMHFIDCLTQISLDCRMVPTLQRQNFLFDSLSELNRRLRRRMITKGDVSIDVEDNRGPYDWPTLDEMTVDLLKYSIHLPLEPKTGVWVGGVNSDSTGSQNAGVMRVMNIVVPSSRILASRERCPFLIHCEVTETGFEGSDARLYATGVSSLGATIEEVLGMTWRKNSPSKNRHNEYSGFPSYRIPSELVYSGDDDNIHLEGRGESNIKDETKSDVKNDSMSNIDTLPRGGYQGYEPPYYGDSGFYPSPFDAVREEQLQQLHEQLQSQQQYQSYVPPHESSPWQAVTDEKTQTLSTYSALLDRIYGLPWAELCEQIRQTSPYGNVKGWRLASFIIKAGEDIRKEALVMQIISKMKMWFDTEIQPANRPYLRPYTIMCVGGDAGLLECVKDAKSVDEVKKETDGFTTLRNYFERAYGPPTRQKMANLGTGQMNLPHNQYEDRRNLYQSRHNNGISFETAQDNFLRSLVGYSLICYILQIKDRHNANILLDREGHLMHIDFGFVLGETPKMGKVPLFSERAPFKLTAEFWEVIGGWNFNEGGLGVRFCKMFEEAFACASSHSDEIATLIETALLNISGNVNEARLLANGVKVRLRMRGGKDSVQQKMFIMDLVNTALTSWGTSTYDWLQKSMNGYI